MKSLSRITVGLIIGVLALQAGAQAQLNVGNYGRVPDRVGMSAGQETEQDKVLAAVRWEQNLQNQLPLEAQFKDESGKTVKFGQYFDGRRPVMLAMIFYNCTMLCSEVVKGLMTSLQEVKLTPGKDYNVVVISINPKEDAELARVNKQKYLAKYGFSKQASGFHFLTGTNENIRKVTDAAGYFYTYDKETEQYAHPGGIVVTTPAGKVARYFTGVLYEPRDVRLSLVEASEGKVGTVRDLILLRCFHFNNTTGKYSLAVMELLRIVAAVFVIVVGSSLALWVRRDLKREKMLAREVPLVNS